MHGELHQYLGGIRECAMNDKHSKGRQKYTEADLVKANKSVLGVHNACSAHMKRQSHVQSIANENDHCIAHEKDKRQSSIV